MIYFDNSSTTSVRTEVCRIYTQLLEYEFGNPDSMHAIGRSAFSKMETSRKKIAEMLRVLPEEILFTSSASESNSLAILGYCLAHMNRGKHILTTNVEHASVDHSFAWLESMGFQVERMPVNENGVVTPEVLRSYLREDTILVSCMHVNNEMGAINPIKELAQLAHTIPTCAFHADCVQSFTKIDIPWNHLDMATVSMHKIHGLKGSALLYKRKGLKLKSLIQGGQQEQGLRGGTSNAPSNIVAAKTIRLALEEQQSNYKKVYELNRYLRSELAKIPGVFINSPQDALPYILNISFDSLGSEVMLNALDQKGICVSAKSTCSSHLHDASSTLLHMGLSQKRATHMIRLSFDGNNTMEEGAQFIQACKEIIEAYGLPL